MAFVVANISDMYTNNENLQPPWRFQIENKYYDILR